MWGRQPVPGSLMLAGLLPGPWPTSGRPAGRTSLRPQHPPPAHIAFTQFDSSPEATAQALRMDVGDLTVCSGLISTEGPLAPCPDVCPGGDRQSSARHTIPTSGASFSSHDSGHSGQDQGQGQVRINLSSQRMLKMLSYFANGNSRVICISCRGRNKSVAGL